MPPRDLGSGNREGHVRPEDLIPDGGVGTVVALDDRMVHVMLVGAEEVEGQRALAFVVLEH